MVGKGIQLLKYQSLVYLQLELLLYLQLALPQSYQNMFAAQKHLCQKRKHIEHQFVPKPSENRLYHKKDQ